MVKAARNCNGKKKGENNRWFGNRYLTWAFIEAAKFICRFKALAQRWRDRKEAASNSRSGCVS